MTESQTCDSPQSYPHASHYLKVMLDGIFGAATFRNEIIWKRTSSHSSAKKYGPIHDVLLYYGAGPKVTWNEPRVEYEDDYLDKYYKYDDGDGRLYWRNSLTAAGTRQGSSGQPWRGIDIAATGQHWKFTTARRRRTRRDRPGLLASGRAWIPSNQAVPR